MRHTGTILLETPRLILRRFRPEDALPMYQGWASREECTRYFPWSPATDLEEIKERLTQWIANYESPDYYQWAIEHDADQTLIGVINLHNPDPLSASAETSYILTPAYWNQGLMTEALKAVLDFAFYTLDLNRVEADVFEGNTPSMRVLEKNSFQYQTTTPAKYQKNNTPITALQYTIQKQTYINL